MKFRILILLFLVLQIFELYAQPAIPKTQIDSIFNKNKTSNGDWALSLSFLQAGTIPLYDSLGNSPYNSPDDGTILFLKLGKDYYYQKLTYNFKSDYLNPSYIISQRKKLPDNISLNFTTDSLLLAEDEWIYSFIWKNENLNTFSMLMPSPHEANYGMYFKVSSHEGFTKFFTELELQEKKDFIKAQNLNYSYNSKTFIYRAFVNLYKIVMTLKI